MEDDAKKNYLRKFKSCGFSFLPSNASPNIMGSVLVRSYYTYKC